MKAIAVHQSLPSSHPECFVEVSLELPPLGARDLLVQVKAVSVNPVDYKVRGSIRERLDRPRVLGWDAAGIVTQVGAEVALFRVGDEVYYAGSIVRPGCDSEYQAVDERIVGRKPTGLSFAEAAVLPLTTITAWEALFERLAVLPNTHQTILIVGGAGGVGSIAIQLAKKVAGLQTIATASREASSQWCLKMGADRCINHQKSFRPELEKLGVAEVDYILCLNDTDGHWQNMADVIKPQGKICSIVGSDHPLDMNLLKPKSVTFIWEFMFTKSSYQTADMQSQHQLLNRVAELIEQGSLQTTLNEHLGGLDAANLAKAHARLESGTTIGKLALSGIEPSLGCHSIAS